MTKPKNPKYPKQLGEPIRWMPAGPPPDAELDVLGEAREEWERKSAEASAKLEAEKASKISVLARHYGVSEGDHWSLLLRVCEDKFRGFKLKTPKPKAKAGRDHRRLLLDVAFAMRDGSIGERQALETLTKTPRYKPKGVRRNNEYGDKVYGDYTSLQSRLREAEKAEPFVKTLIDAGAWTPWLEAMRDRHATD